MADFVVATNATPGNHAVTVTVSGQTSNAVNFFVQIPQKLRRDTYGNLVIIDPGPGQITDSFGRVKATNRCGAYRNIVYQLLDQGGEPILAEVEVTETFDNYQGPPELANQFQPITDFTNNAGQLGDTVAFSTPHPQCPLVFSLTVNQKFSAKVGTTSYPLTTVNSIADAKTSSGSYTINVTITTP